MSNPRILKFINSGPLEFDAVSGFAINPLTNDNAFFSADFINQVITAVGTGTITVYGSAQEIAPDFTAAVTIDNAFVPVMTADYSIANTYYDGATGIVVAGSAKLCEINTNLLTWVAIHRSADTVDALLTETNNQ